MLKKLPKNVKISVVTLHPIQNEVTQILESIIVDYCNRFNKKIVNAPAEIGVAFVEYTPNDYTPRGTTFHNAESNSILVQVRDPYLENMRGDHESEETERVEYHEYVSSTFMQIMCHEFVHVAQYLTDSQGWTLPVAIDTNDASELYFFDPHELEARGLEDFYVCKFAVPLLEKEKNGPGI